MNSPNLNDKVLHEGVFAMVNIDRHAGIVHHGDHQSTNHIPISP